MDKTTRVSVSYGPLELAEREGPAFWNAVHDGVIKEILEDGMVVSIKKDAETINAFIKKEELLSQNTRAPGSTLRVYLEDSLEIKEGVSYPFQGSEIKAIDLDLIDKAELAKTSHEMVQAYVVGTIKGGYSVALFAGNREEAENGFGLRAFLPLGQTSLRRNEGLNEHDDHCISVQIVELSPERGNIVVSRRELLAEEKKKDQEAFFSQHEVGDQVTGVVTAVMPYGLFVSLGSVDGFLHVSDLSWSKKPRPKDMPKEGQEITAKIINIDKENKKVKLSIKGMNTDPWQNIDKLYKPGTEVEGTIVAFAEFGAFVSLQDGVEGLIHVGEITWNRIKHPSQHFKLGDKVKAAVLRVDKEHRRISLSTKATQLSPVERLSGQFPVGAVLKTKIESIHDFGLFVVLDEEANGLVPRSEISWTRNDDPLEKQFSVGQEIEVAVLGYDPRRQRVSCSIKRLTNDPWALWKQKYKRGSNHKVEVKSVSRAGIECELEPGLLGFVPKNQLFSDENDTGRILVKTGDHIEVVITACDPMHQRVSLSQRAAVESETKKAYASYLTEQGKAGGAKTTLADAFKGKAFNNKSEKNG